MISEKISRVAALLLTQGKQPELIKKCLHSLAAQNVVNYDIFLIQNGFNKFLNVDFLVNKNRINFISFNDNLGFTGGFNESLKIIEKNYPDKYTYFWLLNDDLELDINCLQKMLISLESLDDVGFCGPETFNLKNLKMHDQWITYLPNKNNPGNVHLNNEIDLGSKAFIEVEFVVGHCVLVKTKAIKDIGLMRDFFIYWDEREWQWRAKIKGWRSIVIPGSIAYHERDSFKSSKNLYYRTRNYFFFNRIVLKHNNAFILFYFRNIFHEIRGAISTFIRGKYSWVHFCSFVKGMTQGCFLKIPLYDDILSSINVRYLADFTAVKEAKDL